MGATMNFHNLSEGDVIKIGEGADEVRVSVGAGNHPNGVWAFRVEQGGKTIVYATDTEHYAQIDQKLVKLARDADILIYDSQYTPEEYSGTTGTGAPPKVGWGHSTFDEAAKLAHAAKARKLVLYHHDPMQSDSAVREKERRAKELFGNVIAAYEGLVLEP
jgi:ribonuclease BN (tRNA processing enzyme)